MDKTEETTESVDQPLEEESQDQPEVESDESEISEDEADQPDEESDELSPEELKKGYMRDADYRRKTQELAELRRSIEAQSLAAPAPTHSPEEQQALETLDKLGVARKQDVQAIVAQMIAQQNVVNERQRVQAETGMDEDMLYAAQALSIRKGISLSEAAKLLSGKAPDPIKKKSVGVKGGVSTPSALRKSEKITPDMIRNLDMKNPEDVKKLEAYKDQLGM